MMLIGFRIGEETTNKLNIKFDAQINSYAKQGWRVHTLNYGSSVHGGAGQVAVLFERLIELD